MNLDVVLVENREVKQGNRCERNLERYLRERRVDRIRGEEKGIK